MEKTKKNDKIQSTSCFWIIPYFLTILLHADDQPFSIYINICKKCIWQTKRTYIFVCHYYLPSDNFLNKQWKKTTKITRVTSIPLLLAFITGLVNSYTIVSHSECIKFERSKENDKENIQRTKRNWKTRTHHLIFRWSTVILIQNSTERNWTN